MIFAPAQGTAFFESLGWREAEFRSTFPESVRLNRTMRFGHFWHWLSHFYPRKMQQEMRRMSGFVLWNGPNPSAIQPSHSWSLCTALPTIIVMLSLPPSSSAACSRSSHTCLADVMFPRYSPI